MFNEKDFLKDYSKAENSGLVADIVYRWFTMIPILKENNYIAVSEADHYALRMTEDKDISLLYRNEDCHCEIEEIIIPEHIKKYFLYTFEHFALYKEKKDKLCFEDTRYLFDKFGGIRVVINSALYTSYAGGRADGYKWAEVSELTEREFMNLVPRIIEIAYNNEDFGFVPNISLPNILELFLVNDDESLSCESYWRISLDYCRIQIAKINIAADDQETGLNEMGVTACRAPEFAENTVGDILRANEPWYLGRELKPEDANVEEELCAEDELTDEDILMKIE